MRLDIALQALNNQKYHKLNVDLEVESEAGRKSNPHRQEDESMGQYGVYSEQESESAGHSVIFHQKNQDSVGTSSVRSLKNPNMRSFRKASSPEGEMGFPAAVVHARALANVGDLRVSTPIREGRAVTPVEESSSPTKVGDDTATSVEEVAVAIAASDGRTPPILAETSAAAG